MVTNETIAAVATPRGTGGVAIIRISGDDAFKVASKIFVSTTSPEKMKPRTAYFGKIVRGGKVIDSGLLLLFKGPNSYTGEDTAEINCHGGKTVTASVLAAALENGARMALPGEYTKRAFLNGKLLLDEAEAVGEIISADNEKCLEAAAANLVSGVGKKLNNEKEIIKETVARFFAIIDWPDEEIDEEDAEAVCKKLKSVSNELKKLTDTAESGKVMKDGLKTVIAGCPNAGKSTLMNALTGEDRSIVTSVAGTTRDVITESVTVGGIKLVLSDTAGIRDSGDEIEMIGVGKAYSELEHSSLILFTVDGCSEIGEDEKLIAKKASSKGKIIAVFTKNDIAKLDEKQSKAKADKLGIKDYIAVSAKTGENMDGLASLISSFAPKCEENGSVILSERQYGCLIRAKAATDAAIELISSGDAADKTVEELTAALSAISELDGSSVSEEIVSKIFEKFCVGK